ncbi:MAG: hypothetical protein Q7R57_06940 [Dehalococcoidales bacterium]|nr:hypothetical protein [Dehalococcoidales bacterium]
MAEKMVEKKATNKVQAKGQTYGCEVCGLEVVVDEACGCVETHEILCCGAPMKEKPQRKSRAGK